MFDEKYMKSNDKPLKTLEDLVMFVAARCFCSWTNCGECATRMYGRSCSGVSKANKIEYICSDGKRKEFVEKFSGIKLSGLEGIAGQQAVYDALFVDKKPEEKKEEKGEREERKNSCVTCAECMKSKMHTSGILWCENFHNFVHEDGFCYRWEPAKMEEWVV